MSSNLELYYEVTNFWILGPFILSIAFNDGSEQVINFLPLLHGPVFAPLRDLTLFNQVQVNPEIGTIEWPTGADFNPVVLHDWPTYEESLIAEFEKFQAVPA